MHVRGERGLALVAALMTIILMMALGAALVLITSSETMIAANFRASEEAFYAADAVFERALGDLRAVPDWTAVLDGSARSSFADGQPAGARMLMDGRTIDLTQVANMANCQKLTPCTDADVSAKTSERPWGQNNPRWTPYAYGRLTDGLAIAPVNSPYYVMAFVGDDPSENDADPRRDGASVGGMTNPGLGILSLRAEAFGPRRAHKVIEATVARIRTGGGSPGEGEATDLRVLSWREIQ